jgi:hypothetical protein
LSRQVNEKEIPLGILFAFKDLGVQNALAFSQCLWKSVFKNGFSLDSRRFLWYNIATMKYIWTMHSGKCGFTAEGVTLSGVRWDED